MENCSDVDKLSTKDIVDEENELHNGNSKESTENITDTFPKSVLKKTDVVQGCKERHVTFNVTVKVYSDAVSNSEFGSSGESYDVEERELKCGSSPVISSVKSSVSDTCNMLSKWLDCEPKVRSNASLDGYNNDEDSEEFFVHKVIYENNDINECRHDSEKSCDSVVYYALDDDSDTRDFVVHRVTSLEDERLDSSESETDINSPDDSEHRAENEKPFLTDAVVPELSIKNIDEHNRLTEYKIQFENIFSNPLDTVTPVLVPPLQELSVDRLIGPMSDNWFWNLDISPLNSVHESDTESTTSSEDTMIMMTTEESQKNEQHIKESLIKYQCLKKGKNVGESCKEEESSKSPECVENLSVQNDNCIKELGLSKDQYNNSGSSDASSSNDCLSVTESSDNNTVTIIKENVKDPQLHCDKTKINPCSKYIPLLPLPSINKLSIGLNDKNTITGLVKDSSSSQEHSLMSVQIPDDVREWKITSDSKKMHAMNHIAVDKLDSSSTDTFSNFEMNNLNCVSEKLDDDNELKTVLFSSGDSVNLPKTSVTSSGSDELEHFVHECTERVERIRKRYSISEKISWLPKRGIRPRFMSTAEILQQLQNNAQPSIVTFRSPRNHLSWPSFQARTSENSQYFSNNNNKMHTYSVPVSHYSNEKSNALSTENLHSVHYNRKQNGFNVKNNLHAQKCEFFDSRYGHFPYISRHSTSSLPFMSFQERGTPEGASPPKLSSESLCEINQSETLSDSVVYYSMKV